MVWGRMDGVGKPDELTGGDEALSGGKELVMSDDGGGEEVGVFEDWGGEEVGKRGKEIGRLDGRSIGFGSDDDDGVGGEEGAFEDWGGEEVGKTGGKEGRTLDGKRDTGGLSTDDVGVWEVDVTSVDEVEVGGKMQLPRRSRPRGHVRDGEEEEEGEDVGAESEVGAEVGAESEVGGEVGAESEAGGELLV